MAAGWELAPAYRLPTAVTGHVRIGKNAETLPPPGTGEFVLAQPADGSDDLPLTDRSANNTSSTHQPEASGDDQLSGHLTQTTLEQNTEI